MTVHIFYVILDRQVSEKKAYLHIWMYGYCTKQATVNKLTITKYTLRGIRHIWILTEEYLLYKWISRCNKSYTWPQHTVN